MMHDQNPGFTEPDDAPPVPDDDLPPPEPKPRRQVSYNPDAVLCPECKKRIRLNNNGRIRVHAAGKAGSEHCSGSNTVPAELNVQVLADQAEAGSEPARLVPRSTLLFSDLDA